MGADKTFFSKEMDTSTRRTRLPTHVFDSLIQVGQVHAATGVLLNLGTNFQPHRPENAVEHQNSSPLTKIGQTGEHYRSDRSLLVELSDLHIMAPHRSGRCNTPVRPVSARKPQNTNRPTELQTNPNSKQQQHRTTANTPRRSPEQKPNRGCTGQTGERHLSDRCALGFSG
jgi:hypothetical protein